MADSKISALPAATTPLAGTEVLPIVQSGTNKKVPVSDLTAGRNAGMVNAVVSNGIVVQTSGTNRWIIEKGSGDSLFIYRYNDAGGYAGNPVQIDRSNGNVRLENNLVIGTSGNGVILPGNITWTSGSGSPEGVVTAPVGSLYSRTDGGVLTSLYVKQSGTGNTGWAGK